MADIAELGLKIDSSQAAQASRALDQLSKSGKVAEDQFAKIERAARMGGQGTQGYSQALGQAYGLTQQMSAAQVSAIRNYETLIAKTELLNQGRGREAAQLVAVRKAGTTADSEYGKVVASLAGNLYDLEQQQNKTGNSAANFANTLTRRFVLGYLVSQIRQVISSIAALNTELAKTGDVGRFTGIGSQGIQGLQAAATNRGVDSGKFLDDMTAFARQVQQAKIGVGDLGILFRANGLTVKDTGDAFARVADLVRNAKDEATKFSILQQAGLPATREYVKLMEQGSAAIQRQSDEARKLSDQQIKEAQELEDKWNKLWTNVTRWGKEAIVGIFSVPLPDWFKKLAEGTNFGLTGMAGGKQMTGAEGNAFYDAIFGKGGVPGQQRPSITVNAGNTVDPQALQRSYSLESQRLSILGQMATAGQQVRAVEIAIAQARLQGVSITEKEAENLKRLASERALGIDQMKAQTDGYNVEAATIGMTVGAAAEYVAVQSKLNEARRLGIELSPAEIESIRASAAVLGQAAQRASDVKDAYDISKGLFQDFRSNIAQGAKLWDAFGQAGLNALNKIAAKLMDRAFDALWSGSGLGGAAGGVGRGGILGGAIIPGILHEGGLGRDAPSSGRLIHPAYFENAPRFHTGKLPWGPGEMPAIIKPEEEILTTSDPRHRWNGGGARGGDTFNYHDNRSYQDITPDVWAKIEARDRAQKGQWIDEAIRAMQQRRASDPNTFSGG